MRYYCLERPPLPGTIPMYAIISGVEMSREKHYYEELGREAWGYFDTNYQFTLEELSHYGYACPQAWFGVHVRSKNHGGGLNAFTDSQPIYAEERPEDIYTKGPEETEKVRYFNDPARADYVTDTLNSVEITLDRLRGSVTQGACDVYLNGEKIIQFGEKIVLVKKNDNPEDYYGEDIGGWMSAESDGAMTLGIIWHPLDMTLHVSDKVCKALGIEPEQWIE